MYNRQTPYHRRVQARLAKARNLRAITKMDKYAKVDHFMLTYEQAYRAWYGITIRVSYKHGWYYVGQYKYRHSTLEEMTNNILAHMQAEACPQPEDSNNEDVRE